MPKPGFLSACPRQFFNFNVPVDRRGTVFYYINLLFNVNHKQFYKTSLFSIDCKISRCIINITITQVKGEKYGG